MGVVITKTVQVDEDGNRLTAHFGRDADGEWELRDVGGNVGCMPVAVIRALFQAILDEGH